MKDTFALLPLAGAFFVERKAPGTGRDEKRKSAHAAAAAMLQRTLTGAPFGSRCSVNVRTMRNQESVIDG